jgi:hypothetical protein
MNQRIRTQVECHSGYTYAQRPKSLVWEGERLTIMEIQGEWQTPEGRRFQVVTEEEGVFELNYSEKEDFWSIKKS